MEPQNLDFVHSKIVLTDVVKNWSDISSHHAFGDLNLSFGLVEITPEMAFKLLETQHENRTVSQTRVLEYARRLGQDEWTISDAIKFDDTGAMIDGQHRMHGVCRSGISTVFPVIAGYPAHSQSVIDIGMNRTVAQIGQIQGLSVTNQHVSMVRALYLPSSSSSSTTSMLSSPQKVLSLITQHKEAIDFAIKVYSTKPLKLAPVRAVVARAWYHENRKRLEQFLRVFDTGFPEGVEDNAALALRNAIIEMKRAKIDAGMQARTTMALKTVSALEAFLAKEDRKWVREKSVCKWKIAGIDA